MVPDLSPRNFDTHSLLDFDGHPAQNRSIVGEIANPFRGCVLGDYGSASDYAGCISTLNQGNVSDNVRVINSTALP